MKRTLTILLAPVSYTHLICTTQCKFDAIHLERVRDVEGLDYDKLVPSLAPHVMKRYGNIAIKSLTKPFSRK